MAGEVRGTVDEKAMPEGLTDISFAVAELEGRGGRAVARRSWP